MKIATLPAPKRTVALTGLPLFLALQLCALCLVSSSCVYRMPEDDCLYTVPLTNNPNLTNDPGSSVIPGADY